MDIKKAKQLSKLEKELMRKFNEARREEARRLEEVERETMEGTKPAEPKLLLGSLGTSNITVSEAKKIENMEKQLRNEFATSIHREGEELRSLEKQYEPITKVLKETKTQEVSKEIVPVFNPIVTSTPGRKIHWADEDETEESTSPIGLPTTPEKDSF